MENKGFKPVSIHSPRNPYRVEINFNKAVKGLGSVVSFTAESLKGAESLAYAQVRITRVQANIRIYLNKSVYPDFDWERVRNYTLDERGKEIEITCDYE